MRSQHGSRTAEGSLPNSSREVSLGCAAISHLTRVDVDRPCQAHGFHERIGAIPAPFGVVGLSYRTAPVEIRNRVAITGDGVRAFMSAAKEVGFSECVVLSTCNRVEVYYSGVTSDVVRELLARHCEVPLAELRPFLFEKSCVCAACHLFRVTAGLDSAVLGETEIVAQVKHAWRSGSTGTLLELLFQRALETSKRIRSETELCRNVTSTGAMAVRLAEARLGSLAGKRIALVGAGAIAERIAKELAGSGADITILNRTVSHAEELTARWGGRAKPISELDATVAIADVVLTAVASPTQILTSTSLQRLSASRSGRPLTVIDLGMPANVELNHAAEGIEVIDLQTLSDACAENGERRASAIPACLEILDEELARFGATLTQRAAAPTIRALVLRGEEIRQRNVDWAKKRLDHLSSKELRVVEEMARRMMIGLLQAPIDGLKNELAAEHHREVVERLFDLNGGFADR